MSPGDRAARPSSSNRSAVATWARASRGAGVVARIGRAGRGVLSDARLLGRSLGGSRASGDSTGRSAGGSAVTAAQYVGPDHGERLPAAAPGPRLSPTRWARSRPAGAIRALGQAAAVAPFLRTQLSVESFGVAELDRLRQVIFVANHASHLDAAVVVSALPPWRRARTVVAGSATAFFDAWWRALPAALMFNAVAVGSDLREVERLLALGWSVLVFGQPSRADDGSITGFDDTAARLARTTGLPVVPVGIRGTFAALPRGSATVRPGRPRVSVRFAGPTGIVPGESDEAFTRRLTDAVRMLVAEDRETWWQVLRHGAPAPDPSPDAARWRRVWSATDEMAKGGRPRSSRIWS